MAFANSKISPMLFRGQVYMTTIIPHYTYLARLGLAWHSMVLPFPKMHPVTKDVHPDQNGVSEQSVLRKGRKTGYKKFLTVTVYGRGVIHFYGVCVSDSPKKNCEFF